MKINIFDTEGSSKNSSGYVPSEPVVDPDANKVKISFDQNTVTVTEGTSIAITISLDAIQSTDTLIGINLTSSSAFNRFNPIPSSVIIPAGQQSISINLNTIDDTVIQDAETWNLNLSFDHSTFALLNSFSAILDDNDGGIPSSGGGSVVLVPHLLKDLNVLPENLISINFQGKMFFVGSDINNGSELWVSDGTALGTKLLLDIYPGKGSSKITSFLKDDTDTYFYFTADHPSYGFEIWVSDGTLAGTQLLMDIEPGVGSSTPFLYYAKNGKVFFQAETTLGGLETYVSAGTSATTQMLFEMYPGISGAGPIGNFVEYKGSSYFSISTYSGYTRIYSTDGTTAGTVLKVSQNSTGGTLWPWAPYLTVYNNLLFFEANTSGGGPGLEPYVSDGTNSGTKILKDVYPGMNSSTPKFYNQDLGGKILFTVTSDDPAHSTGGFYTTTGTPAGTLWVPTTPYFTSYFGAIGGRIIFSGMGPDLELWSTDGSSAGTTLIKDIEVGSTGSNPTLGIQMGSKIFFSATTSAEGTELWSTDGTPAGTVLVKDISQGNSSSNPNTFFSLGSKVIFRASTVTHGEEIWISDGTAAGTYELDDLNPGAGDSGAIGFTQFDVSSIFFAAYNSSAHYGVTYVSDLSKAGTIGFPHSLVQSKGSSSSSFFQFGSNVFFNAMDSTRGNQLWATDGSPTNTLKIKDINTNVTCTDIDNLFAFSGSIFFMGTEKDTGRELLISDGSSVGTNVLKDINPGSASGFSAYAYPTTIAGTQFFFTATDNNGDELWVSDGTAIGTHLVKDLYTGTSLVNGVTKNNSGSPSQITQISNSNEVIFLAYTGASTRSFFTSDGTSANTLSINGISNFPNAAGQVAEIIKGSGNTIYLYVEDSSNSKRRIYNYNHTTKLVTLLTTTYATDSVSGSPSFNFATGKIYWQTANGAAEKLWVSDGISANNISLIGSSSLVSNVYFDQTKTYFSRYTTGYELLVTDGTIANTKTLGTFDNSPTLLISHNGLSYFTFDGTINGYELWVTDGTAVGTHLVKDIYPGATSSMSEYYLYPFLVFQNKVYFVAKDSSHGNELWRTDGTEAGTELVYDLNEGADSSNPNNFIILNNKLFFTASSILAGDEVWVYSP